MRVEQVQATLVVEADASLPLYAGPPMDGVRKRVGGDLVRPNLPETAPPELPRLAVRLEDAVLQISYSRIEFIARPPRHVAASYDSSLEFSIASARQYFGEILDSLAMSPTFQWSAVIATANFPQLTGKSAARARPMAAIAETADVLLNADLKRQASKLAGFDLRIGYLRSGHYVNYHVAEYVVKEALVRVADDDQPVQINMDDLAAQELGIGLTIDVNSRPRSPHGEREPIDDLLQTWEEHKRAFKRYPKDLGLHGALE